MYRCRFADSCCYHVVAVTTTLLPLTPHCCWCWFYQTHHGYQYLSSFATYSRMLTDFYELICHVVLYDLPINHSWRHIITSSRDGPITFTEWIHLCYDVNQSPHDDHLYLLTSSRHSHGAPYTDHTWLVLPPGGYSMVHSPHRRLSDVLKRKKPPKRTSGRKSSRGEETGLEFFSAKGASGSTRSAPTTRGKLLAGQYTPSD